MTDRALLEAAARAAWTRTLPTGPGIFEHRNLENAKGRLPILARVMYVGYANWSQDRKLGHGTKPPDYIMPARLRACRIDHPLTADSLTVQEWGGEWRPASIPAEAAEREGK